MSQIFNRFDYRYAWRRNKFSGVLRRFFRDLKCCKDRIAKGYCEYDTWSIRDWFLSVFPPMLQVYKENRHGSPACLETSSDGDPHAAWDTILNRLLFLLSEMDEEKCSKKNPYEVDWGNIQKEFEDKYGFFGEALLTEEEKEESRRTGSTRWHLPSELPEYQETLEKWRNSEREIEEYRDKCKDEAFQIIGKYFWNLWD